MQEKFFTKNPKGQKIVGLIDKPKGEGPFPAIIIFHGFKGYKEQFYIIRLAEELSKAGFIVFRVDQTNGIGESDGNIFNTGPSHYLEDVKSTYDYVFSYSFVDKNNIIIYGSSLGGLVSILFASEKPRIKGLILHEPAIAPNRKLFEGMGVDIEKYREQGYWVFHSRSKNIDWKVSYTFYEDILSYNNVFGYIEKIEVPTLILHNPEAKLLTYKNSERAITMLPRGSKLISLKGVPHTPETDEEMTPILDGVKNWLGTLLSNTD